MANRIYPSLGPRGSGYYGSGSGGSGSDSGNNNNNNSSSSSSSGTAKAAPVGEFFGTPLTYFPQYSMASLFPQLPPAGPAQYSSGLWGLPSTQPTPTPTPTPNNNEDDDDEDDDDRGMIGGGGGGVGRSIYSKYLKGYGF